MIIKEYINTIVEFADHILPRLSHNEQSLATLFFFRTLAVGSNECTIHFDDMCLLTGRSEATLRRALAELKRKGVIDIAEKGTSWKARTYRFLWPIELPRLIKESDEANLRRLARDPEYLMIPNAVTNPASPPHILDLLDKEDMSKLDSLRASLTLEDLDILRIRAARLLPPGGDIPRKIMEILAKERLGPAILNKYEISGNDRK